MKGSTLTTKLGIRMPRWMRELARRGPAPQAVPEELGAEVARLPPAPQASLLQRQERRRRRAARAA